MDASKLSVEEVLELGKLRMKENKPQEARRVLHDVYSRLEARPINLLDSLVSVSLNLEDDHRAMRYATEMSQMYPTSALV
jgi:hypothetical protein